MFNYLFENYRLKLLFDLKHPSHGYVFGVERGTQKHIYAQLPRVM